MHTTEGIILKKESWGEADLMVTILTRDFGKIAVMAQGVKKEAAKLKGHLEPMTHSSISFVVGKNMYRAIAAGANNFFQNIRNDYQKLTAASYIMRLICSNAFEEREDPRLFELVRDTFALLDEARVGAGEQKAIVRDFHVRFLDIFGLLPRSTEGHQSIRAVLANQFGVGYDIMNL